MLTMTVPAAYDEIDQAAVRLRTAAASVLEGAMLDRFELATVEALTNIVRHAYREEPDRKINVEMIEVPGGLALHLCDTGRAAASDLNLFIVDAADDDRIFEGIAESGRGLELIRRCASEVEYRQGPDYNQLRLIFIIPL